MMKSAYLPVSMEPILSCAPSALAGLKEAARTASSSGTPQEMALVRHFHKLDAEQAMVAKLCKENKLDDEHYLIKDGSIEYAPSHSHNSHQQSLVVSNYKHVVGVSKLFNPELLKDFEGKRLSQTIAGLKSFERTKAYRYLSDITKQEYAVWYLRLRKDYPRETNYSDVIKCGIV